MGLSVAGGASSHFTRFAELDLSRRRAETVRKVLIDKGIEADLLTAVGYGETRPRADNSNYQGRAKNRRVEFQILR